MPWTHPPASTSSTAGTTNMHYQRGWEALGKGRMWIFIRKIVGGEDVWRGEKRQGKDFPLTQGHQQVLCARRRCHRTAGWWDSPPPLPPGTRALPEHLPLESNATANSVSQSSVPKGLVLLQPNVFIVFIKELLFLLSSKKVRGNSEYISVPSDKDMRKKEGKKEGRKDRL